MSLIDKYLAPGETCWADIAERVAGIMTKKSEREEVERAIESKKFIPNSPALVFGNLGGSRNMMACHVLEVPNSIEGIMDTAKTAALVFRSGGGVGYELSALSPHGTSLNYAPSGVASGPVSFLKIFNAVAQTVMEGGLRRAAQMATLNVQHPDIERFIRCKEKDGVLKNFNLSVTITEGGPRAVKKRDWDGIVHHAWHNGEPGVAYLDNINKDNRLLGTHGPIKGLNACAEQPLHDQGSCCLGHVVLPHVVTKIGDWAEVNRVARLATRFLDRVIDINHYPTSAIASHARDVRRIGVGVMGFYDLCQKVDIPFTSSAALQLADELGYVLYKAVHLESWKLAEEKGGYAPDKRRNSSLTTIAPTGHTSRLAGVENAIYAPYDLALKMTPEEHLKLVAAWQPYIDSAISYTFNFGEDTEPADIDRLFRQAYHKGIKVMSVYRDGSRSDQPCSAKGTCSI